MENDIKELRQIHIINLRGHIENEVRNAILRGIFKPGERLVESLIATKLGVSRAPVREVLSALEREGLVVNYPRRGNFVVDFTEKDIDEIYSLRLVMEICALRRAITRVQGKDLEDMQDIINKLGDANLSNADPLMIMALDLTFHERIYDLADHSRMRGIWISIRQQIQLLIGWTTRTHTMPDQPKKLHQQILDAMRENDLQTAENTLTSHILDAQQRALQSLRLKQLARQDQDKAH